jgi:hypothetical protein
MVVGLGLGSCSDDTFGDLPGAETCSPSAKRCAGPAVQICGSDGKGWFPLRDCNQDEVCVAGQCEPSGPGDSCGDSMCSNGENCQNCPLDCACKAGLRCISAACRSLSVCGDGTCSKDETCQQCPKDCGCTAAQTCLTNGPCAGVCAIVVSDKTDDAVRSAVSAAAEASAVYLPPGDYAFARSVQITKSLRICGGATLGKAAVGDAAADPPPAWDGVPTACATTDPNVTLFSVQADDVTIRGIKLQGAALNPQSAASGLSISGHNGLAVEGCELLHNDRAIAFENSRSGRVVDSFIHDNWAGTTGCGIAVMGLPADQGGSEVHVRGCEFSQNRQDILSGGPKTQWVAEGNRFHDSYAPRTAWSVDALAHGGSTLRGVIRDNHFSNAMPIRVSSGSWTITGNSIDSSCGSFGAPMIDLGSPVLSGASGGSYVPSAQLHDIYISRNVNTSGQALVSVNAYAYPNDATKWVSYNLFVDGELWEKSHAEHPPHGSDPSPWVGDAYITSPGGSNALGTIVRGQWYDLHALGVDPQGAANISDVALQLVDASSFGCAPRMLDEGNFSASGSYFVRHDETGWRAREQEGASVWSAVSSVGMYLDGSKSSLKPDGGDRVHWIARIKVPFDAQAGSWRIYATVRDAEGHVPIAAWSEDPVGWPITVQ